MNSKKLSEIAAVLNLEIIRKAPDFFVCSIPGRKDSELTIEKNGSMVSFTIGRYGGASNFVQIPNVKEGEELHQFNLAKSIVPEGDREYISQMYLEVQSSLSENSRQLIGFRNGLVATNQEINSSRSSLDNVKQQLDRNTKQLTYNYDRHSSSLTDINNKIDDIDNALSSSLNIIQQQPTQMNAPASHQGQINVDLIAARTSEVVQTKLRPVFNAIDKKIDFIGDETISIKRETQQLERIIQQSNVKAEVPYMEILKKPGISLEDIAVSIDKLTAQIDSRINSLSSKIATIEQSQQALDKQNAAALSRANTNEIVPKLNDIFNELKPLKTDLLAWNRRNFRFTLVFAAIACVASSFIFTSSGFGRNEFEPTTERTIRALPNP